MVRVSILYIPLIASLSKLSALQADVKSTESEILNTLFSGHYS